MTQPRPAPPVIACVYARISKDIEHLGLGVERQKTDCIEYIERQGWEVGPIMMDNDISASNGRRRPAYQKMLAAIESGAVGAVVVFDLDRLCRQPAELEHFINLADKHNILLGSIAGEIDLSTPQGRLTARIKGAVARHEVEQTSRRLKRKLQERAESGQPHGQRAYGWDRIDGKDVINEIEAAVVGEVIWRLLDGEHVSAITNDLNARGITSNKGLEWHRAMVRQIATRPRNIGLRLHHGEVVGKGDWEPIISEDNHQRVVALLSDPTRRTAPTNRYRHLLTGIALCGKCETPVRLLAAHQGKSKSYSCPKCMGVRRQQAHTDAIITELLMQRLERPDAAELFTTTDTAPILARVEALQARLLGAADDYAVGIIDRSQMARVTATLRPQIEELNRQIGASMPSDWGDIPGPGIRERWPNLPIARQRAVVDKLMKITLLPRGQSGNRYDPNSVAVDWRLEASEAR